MRGYSFDRISIRDYFTGTLLKLSKPVQHHLDLRWGLVRPARLNHEKSLAILGDVVVGTDEARKLVMSFEEQVG